MDGNGQCRDAIPPVIKIFGDDPTILSQCKVCDLPWTDPHPEDRVHDGELFRADPTWNTTRYGYMGYDPFVNCRTGKMEYIDIGNKIQVTTQQTERAGEFIKEYSYVDEQGIRHHARRTIIVQVQDINKIIMEMRDFLEENSEEFRTMIARNENKTSTLSTTTWVLLLFVGILVLILGLLLKKLSTSTSRKKWQEMYRKQFYKDE